MLNYGHPDSIDLEVANNGKALNLYITYRAGEDGPLAQLSPEVVLYSGGTQHSPHRPPSRIYAGSINSGAVPQVLEFPLLDAPVDDAWIRVSIGIGVYWLYVPYGLSATPAHAEKLAPMKLASSPPRVPIKEGDALLPCEFVGFKTSLGYVRIANNSQSLLEISWDKRAFNKAAGKVSNGDLRQSRLRISYTPDDAQNKRATMEFRKIAVRTDIEGNVCETFAVDQGEDFNRTWGVLTFSVGDEKMICRLPASLFRAAAVVGLPPNVTMVDRGNALRLNNRYFYIPGY
jgi:hypothetical protein